MKYASVCSGIGSDCLAFAPLGWSCSFFSEIEKFPSEVLKQRFPNVPNIGDFTEVNPDEWKASNIELLVGGTPCQSFSVGGRRNGMDDGRGVLALHHVRLARSLGAKWFLWENVKGALYTNGGKDFKRLLCTLQECGYGFAYRVLNARNFGVPQRRQRLFIVGYFGDYRPAAAVLFTAPIVFGSSKENQKEKSGDASPNIESFDQRRGKLSYGFTYQLGRGVECFPTLDADKSGRFYVVQEDRYTGELSKVRKLTPVECERLQGLPDNHTAIHWAGYTPDNCPKRVRYKAIGNSIAVPVLSWLGRRIEVLRKFNRIIRKEKEELCTTKHNNKSQKK